MTGPSDPTEPTPAQPVPAAQGPAAQPVPTAEPGAPTWFGTTTPPPPVAHEVPVAPVAAVRSPSRKRGVVDVVLVVALIFAVGGVGFAAGRITAPATATVAGAGRTGNGNFPGGGQFPGAGEFGNGGGNRGNGFGFGGGAGGINITGTVTEITADHLTLKLASGQSIQIALNGSTAYHSQTTATATDVRAGSTVQVQLTRGAGATGGGTGGTGNGTGGLSLGAASSVTVIPK